MGLSECDVLVIGGGAAGFFSAIHAAAQKPNLRVQIVERSDKLLTKVLISGGERCNVTHACYGIDQLISHYPRGAEFLHTAFHYFAVAETVQWFKNRGVQLKTENDGRMFPITDNSETIANCLIEEAKDLGVTIVTRCGVKSIQRDTGQFRLDTTLGPMLATNVIICTGGGSNDSGMEWIRELGIATSHLVPSLFTFNLPNDPIRELTGVSVPNAGIRLRGQDHFQNGPLLITHWGLSGPAALRLSAWEARSLAEKNYEVELEVDWTGLGNATEIARRLSLYAKEHPKKQIINSRPFPEIPERLWEFLCKKEFNQPFRNWAECGKKLFEGLCKQLGHMPAKVKGKTRFKEEFVTCGGVELHEIDPNTCMANAVPGLFFAGEVLDIDGITGGFNFQSAWTTGYLAGKSAANRC